MFYLLLETKADKLVFQEHFKNLVKQHSNAEAKCILIRCFAADAETRNVVDSDGETLLHLAAKYNNVDLIEFLVNTRCYVNAKNSIGKTPLLTALFFNHWKAAEILLTGHADVCVSDVESVLRVLSAKANMPESLARALMRELKKCCGSVETLADLLQKVNCPLKFVVYASDARLTRMILRMPDYEIGYKESSAALRCAMETVDLENLRVLWQSYRMTDPRNGLLREIQSWICSSDRPAEWRYMRRVFQGLVHWIVFDVYFVKFLEDVFSKAGKPELAVLLQQCHVDAQIRQTHGLDVLPILFGNSKLNVEDLIELANIGRLNVNARSINGSSAIHFALTGGSPEKVRFLIELGADCNIKNDDGHTPLHYLYHQLGFNKFNNDCLQLLLQNGASLHITDYNNLTVIEKKLSERGTLVIYNVFRFILAQLAIDHYLGVQVKQTVLQQLKEIKIRLSKTYEDYLLEVKKLMSIEVFPALTLFTFMTAKATNVAHYVQSRRTISEIMEFADSFDSYYRSLLEKKLDEAWVAYRSKCRVAAIISQSTSTPIDFDHLVIHKIWDFLCYRDVLTFAKM